MPEGRRYRSILMFGVPGSGKGTQGEVLGKMPNLVHLAMGDIFRALDKESGIGKEFLSYSTKGLLVPDELTIRVFRRHVEAMAKRSEIDADYHTLILDGIPRTVEQVKLLEEAIDVCRVVYLAMDDREALVARLAGRARKSNRPDDADRAVIENRIDVFMRETKPVLEAYSAGSIAKINADQPPLAVLRDVAGCLVAHVPARV